MPLKKGKTDKIIGDNISELMGSYKKKGKIGTSKPSSKKKAQKQAVAIALNQAGKSKMDEIASQYISKDALLEGLAGAVGGALGGVAGAAGGPIGSAVGSVVGKQLGNALAGDEEGKAKKTLCGRCGHRHVKGTKCPRPFKKKS